MGVVQRRSFLIAVWALLAAPLAAEAQQAAKVARIGYLSRPPRHYLKGCTTALLLATWSASVGALDLTGTWEGQWHCSVQISGVPDHVSNPASTMKISQAGNTLGVEIDGPLFRYNGLAQADSTDPDTGAATFISCRTDTSLVNPCRLQRAHQCRRRDESRQRQRAGQGNVDESAVRRQCRSRRVPLYPQARQQRGPGRACQLHTVASYAGATAKSEPVLIAVALAYAALRHQMRVIAFITDPPTIHDTLVHPGRADGTVRIARARSPKYRSTEMCLDVLACNVKFVMQIIGIRPLMQDNASIPAR